MIPTSFNYTKASSLSDALNALNDDSKILAGGHSLIPALKLRLNETDTLIDISKLSELQGISMDGNDLLIGAGATHAEIASSETVKQHAPLFAMVAAQIGDIQVRNKGTIGGSIAHADPAADWPAALLACEASVEVQSSAGNRSIAASDFFIGIFTTSLQSDEIITGIRVASQAGRMCTYQKFAQPASRFALVGCAVCASGSRDGLSNVRVAFTGVSDTPYRDTSVEAAIEGKGVNQETKDAAANAIDKSIYVMSDHFASEKYRSHLAGVMLGRALEAL